MNFTQADVERIAALAALDVSEEALSGLAEQITHILAYVSQVETAVDTGGVELSVWLGTDPPQPLRADELTPPDLQRELASFAPAFEQGFFVVPRLPAMEEE